MNTSKFVCYISQAKQIATFVLLLAKLTKDNSYFLKRYNLSQPTCPSPTLPFYISTFFSSSRQHIFILPSLFFFFFYPISTLLSLRPLSSFILHLIIIIIIFCCICLICAFVDCFRFFVTHVCLLIGLWLYSIYFLIFILYLCILIFRGEDSRYALLHLVLTFCGVLILQ